MARVSGGRNPLDYVSSEDLSNSSGTSAHSVAVPGSPSSP